MEINKETAMRLWTKNFGKDLKAFDFAGREMIKAAYDDRNSKYGWNIDHVLPQSKGGKTADYNLVCCHILTNDEKADRFPCFTANGKRFEIVRVQNHYEIRQRGRDDPDGSDDEEDEEGENFFDAAYGVGLIKRLGDSFGEERFVGTVEIQLGIYSFAVLDFIEKIFDTENVSYDTRSTHCIITVKHYDMPMKEDISALLDKCILLNTYLSGYFVPNGLVDGYHIHYGVKRYNRRRDFYANVGPIVLHMMSLDNKLYINENVVINTEASDKIKNNHSEWHEYNYVFTELKSDLKKMGR